MVRKPRRDASATIIPPVASRIPAIDGRLRFLPGKNKRPLINLDKEHPDAALTAAIDLDAAEHVLVLNCGDGVVGIVLAALNPTAAVVLHDANLAETNLARQNVDLNARVVPNVRVVTGQDQDQDLHRAIQVARVVFCPDRSMSLNMIATTMAFGRSVLRQPGGRFSLITHKRIGGLRHEAMLSAEFGVETVLIDRGRGGYLLFEVICDVNDRTDAPPTLRRPIGFDVLGRHFDVETEPSLFSKDDLDEGTRLLLERVDLSSFTRALDVGCGWGAIGLVAATVNGAGRVTMLDVDTRAVHLAMDNARALGLGERVEAIATADVRAIPGTFDLILSNPPFHADRETLIGLFSGASDKLAAGGAVFLVVERTYVAKFEHILARAFGRPATIHAARGQFTILTLRR